jgi:hypothetical protein
MNSLLAQCIIVFICQALFVGLRTVNVQHVVNGSIWQNIKSGLAVNITWIISTSLGVKSILTGNMLLLAVYVLGGILGTVVSLLKTGRHWHKHPEYAEEVSNSRV